MQFVLPNNSDPFGSPLDQQLRGPIQTTGSKVPQKIPAHLDGLKRAINFNADYGGCGFWRMIWPEMMLNMYQLGIIQGTTAMVTDNRFFGDVTTVRIQRQATDHQRIFAKYLKDLSRATNNFKLVYEIDDIVFREDIPDYNTCKKEFDDPKIAENCLEIMRMCDEITVTCKYMQEYYKNKTGNQNVKVVPNYVPKFWMDRFYSSQKISERFDLNKKRPRIGYVGSGTHTDLNNAVGQKDDFAHIIEAVTKTKKDFKWVFVGTIPGPLRPLVQSGEIEYLPWTNLNDYPALFDKANVSITIAPLIDNTFNKAKSNIKYLEAGCFGIPCICQDLVTYEMAPLRFKTGAEMVDHIKKLTGDAQLYKKYSKLSRQYADTMWMDDHLPEYVDLYNLHKTTGS